MTTLEYIEAGMKHATGQRLQNLENLYNSPKYIYLRNEKKFSQDPDKISWQSWARETGYHINITVSTQSQYCQVSGCMVTTYGRQRINHFSGPLCPVDVALRYVWEHIQSNFERKDFLRFVQKIGYDIDQITKVWYYPMHTIYNNLDLNNRVFSPKQRENFEHKIPAVFGWHIK